MAEESWNEVQAAAFGRVLAELRGSARLSQRKLADRSGISHTTVARLESGKAGSRGKPVRPGPDTLQALAYALAGLAGLPDGPIGPPDEHRLNSIHGRLIHAAGYRLLFSSSSLEILQSLSMDHADPELADISGLRAEIAEALRDLGETVALDDIPPADLRMMSEILEALSARWRSKYVPAIRFPPVRFRRSSDGLRLPDGEDPDAPTT